MNLSIVTLGLASALAATVGTTARASAPPTPATVALVGEAAHLGPLAVGANAAVWDGNLLDAAVPRLLSDAGVRAVRYPGGSAADVYHWQSNTTVPGQSYANPSNTFDAFMGVAEAADARPIITVNYGSGTPEEAAGWVQYANRGGRDYSGPVPTYPGASASGHRYDVKYWEIGNEIYGNGTYNAQWEYDVNGLGPSVYASNVVRYSEAMKAADPKIKVGAVLTAPGNWPDGQTSASSPLPWNPTVLAAACQTIDFVAVHWYPQGPTGESDPALLASPQQGETTSVSYTPSIPSLVASLRKEIAQYCGEHASHVEILVTETNSVSYNPGKQTTSVVDALFLADSVATWLENGVTNVDVWAIHNGPVCGTNDAPSLYGAYDFGDYGILSTGGSCSDTVAEPAAETPFPSYYGIQLLSRVVGRRGTILRATSSAGLLSAHAVRHDDATDVLLVNKDPAAPYRVELSLGDDRERRSAEVLSYGEDSTVVAARVVPVYRGALTITVAPFSLTAIRVE